jgi:hypothetical protein
MKKAESVERDCMMRLKFSRNERQKEEAFERQDRGNVSNPSLFAK